ncbi:19885_t:CDS:2 [Gigaspora margarita]|uniref:19885_t:CDS:1 n=1 Tax=Gigaspora margarita TaxID=4874 RepID=A0ABN7URG7_GIGMA|nr:19885_t:CDS:2 [Gigaspora margarita]
MTRFVEKSVVIIIHVKKSVPLLATQAATVQVTEENKEGTCPYTDKKRKAEELEEREKSRKMLKHREETPQNASAKVNKTNGNISLQQTEQTEMDIHTQLAEITVTDNKDTSKQSWAKMTDNDSNNLKDITNATNPWATPSTSETYAEQISTESSTSTNGKIENAREPNLYPDYKHKDMQTEVAPHVTQAESNESAINEESTYEKKVKTPSISSDRSDEKMEAEPSDSSKDTKEEITYKEKEETPIVASVSPDIEMVVEFADLLRDELADLYRNAGDKENLLPVAAKTNTSVEDMQASMLSQVIR